MYRQYDREPDKSEDMEDQNKAGMYDTMQEYGQMQHGGMNQHGYMPYGGMQTMINGRPMMCYPMMYGGHMGHYNEDQMDQYGNGYQYPPMYRQFGMQGRMPYYNRPRPYFYPRPRPFYPYVFPFVFPIYPQHYGYDYDYYSDGEHDFY